MKTLTIRQPWAHLIIHGDKRVENRSRRTTYRGPLWIHAGLRLDDHADLGRRAARVIETTEMVFGAIIGMVTVVDCVAFVEGIANHFVTGPWCWILDNPRVLRNPVFCRGHLGFFEHPNISELSEFGAIAPIGA